MLPAPASVNQRLPSGPVVIPGAAVGRGDRELSDGASRGIDLARCWLPSSSVNQRLPSGPVVMLKRHRFGRGDRELGDHVQSVGLIRPILLPMSGTR